MPTEVPRTGRVRITALSYGPHGIGRLAGKVVFVRGVVPGEAVDIRIREDRRSFAYADLVTVADPSPDRRPAPCPYLPRCGGCPWQHLVPAAQRQAKVANLRDHLRRTAGIDPTVVRPILASPHEFGYRGRLTLRVAERQVGFHAAASHELVPVGHCLLADDAVNAALPAVAALPPRLASRLRRIEIARRGSLPGVVCSGEVEGGFAPNDSATVDAWLREHPDVSGLALHGKRWRRQWGDDRLTWEPEDGVVLTARAGTFTQVNPAGNRLLVASVLDLGAFTARDRVVEVHAGAGNLTVPIARRARDVLAIESHAQAAADARANVGAAAAGRAVVRTAAAHTALRDLVDRGDRPDVVVLDPPRSGAAELTAALLALRPARCIYVSCNPATLARDLARLTPAYRVDVVQPIDLFPQTYHVEAVVRAVLTC